MRVIEWVDKSLILEGDLKTGIQEAFDERRYVEAFALLHGWINWLMHFVYENSQLDKPGTDLRKLIDENPSWKTSLDRLSKNGIITEKEKERLVAFNQLRNSIVHRLIVRGYQSSREEKVTQDEVDIGFEEGKALVALLTAKTSFVILGGKGHD